MKKIAVVFWSGTGNTEIMANKIADGASGAEVSIFSASEFDVATVADYDVIAFGCPASGAEELEESEFAPMFDECKANLSGKNIALFGSYGWGGGEWLDTWKSDCEALGANVIEVLALEATPDGDGEEACIKLGQNIAS